MRLAQVPGIKPSLLISGLIDRGVVDLELDPATALVVSPLQVLVAQKPHQQPQMYRH